MILVWSCHRSRHRNCGCTRTSSWTGTSRRRRRRHCWQRYKLPHFHLKFTFKILSIVVQTPPHSHKSNPTSGQVRTSVTQSSQESRWILWCVYVCSLGEKGTAFKKSGKYSQIPGQTQILGNVVVAATAADKIKRIVRHHKRYEDVWLCMYAYGWDRSGSRTGGPAYPLIYGSSHPVISSIDSFVRSLIHWSPHVVELSDIVFHGCT